MWTNEKEEEFQKLYQQRETYQAQKDLRKKSACEMLDEIKSLFDDDKIRLIFRTENLYDKYCTPYGDYLVNPIGKKIIFEYYFKEPTKFQFTIY